MLVPLLLACADPPPTDTALRVDDTAPTGPTGDSIEDAIPLDGTATDAIDPAGDVDYWAVTLDEGEFLELRTITVAGDPEDPTFDCDGSFDTNPLDTVVTVYDPAGEEALSADNWGQDVCGLDSLGLFRADVAGTWTLAVTDWNNWEDGGGMFGNPPAGGAEYTYTLHTTAGSPQDGGGALPDEPVIATLADDAWTFTVDTRAWVSLYTPYATNQGLDGLVFELSSDGEILGRADADAFYGTRWGLGIQAPLEPGEYSLSVSSDDGADDWSWLWRTDDTGKAGNPEVEPNDAYAYATPVSTQPGEGEYSGDYVVSRFDGTLAPGDTDVFSATVEDGQWLYLSVYTGQVGSLVEATFSLVDVDGVTVIDTAESDEAFMTAERASGAGTIAVSLTGTGAETSGYYVATLEIWDSRRPW